MSEQPERIPERIYEWDVAQIGHEAPAYVYEVTRENIADYCRAVRYENPVYTSDGAAKEMGLPGAVAPPTMMYTYAPQRRSAVIEAQGYIAPEQSQTNPRSTPFVSTKVHFQGAYAQPGDTITSITRVSEKFERRGNKFLTFHVSATNQHNEPVVEYDYVCLWEYAPRTQTSI